MNDLHPMIALFESHAELLEVAGDRGNLDDAIVKLAAWMMLARGHLNEDDMAVLGEVGARMYREGMRRREAE